jgi:membrane protease YdiL (CAAX protease family)
MISSKGIYNMNESERKNTLWRIVIFSVLVLGAAWLGPVLGGSPASPGLGFILWGTGPMLVSLMMRWVTKDWSNLEGKPAFGKNARWYWVSLLFFPVIFALTLLVGVLTSLSSVSEFSIGKYLQTSLIALGFFLIFAVFEEVGWRGYLSPKLDSLGLNRFIASAFVAVVWGTWHMPYIRELTWVYSSENLATFIPRFYLVCFALALVFDEIRRITGTFWPAVIMHGVGNAFGHPLVAGYVAYAAGMEYLGSVSNGLLMIVLAIIVGIVIHWRRLTYPGTAQISKTSS